MIIENNPDLKYRYSVFTWGGFYNKEYEHDHKEGLHIFDTKEERDSYLIMLKGVAQAMNANYLMSVEDEGFNVQEPVVLHRVIELNGKYYYSKSVTHVWESINQRFATACYYIDNKWYPGFNDYPAGDDADYENARVIQEWITGAFKPEDR